MSTVLALLWVLAYQGFTMAINGIGAPFIARDFRLGDAGIAMLYACVALAALGVLALSRLADRVGRRRVVLAAMAATPVAALAAAAAQGLVAFALAFMLVNVFAGTAVSGAVVMLAEEFPAQGRARGQGLGGVAAALGAGLCLLLMPLLDHGGHSWRWLLVVSGSGLLTVPLLAWAVPESPLWERAARQGAAASSALFAPFRAPLRSRAVPLMACTVLSVMAGTTADVWSYYHAVSVVGLSAATGSAVILAGGALGLSGFPLGAWACERFGRVPTVAVAWMVNAAGALLFYAGPSLGLGPPTPLGMGLAFLGMSMGFNAALVGFRAATTELFPTSMRGTVMGWTAFMGAWGVVLARGMVAALTTRVGGLSPVVAAMALLAVPSALILLLFVDETRGASLEEPAVGEGPVAREAL